MSIKGVFLRSWNRLIQRYIQKDDNRQSRRIHICLTAFIALIVFMSLTLWFKYEDYAQITHRREMLETPEGITEVDYRMIS